MTSKTLTLEATSRRMARVRQTGTEAELALRSRLFKRGLRYRVNYTVIKQPRRVADIVFPKLKLAIFVDGCFWHGCPIHASWPKRNAEFWQKKIEKNRERDNDTNVRLRAAGWKVIRVWEHESPEVAAEAIFKWVQSSKTLHP